MKKIAVVVPCYRVKEQILDVLRRMGPEVSSIVCVDDACPEASGKWIESQSKDPRVRVVFHEKNQGVGGALVTGYRSALELDADVVVKIDGDGQMDPKLLGLFAKPILDGKADYTKGNRFSQVRGLEKMPRLRLFGNSVLSLLCKVMSGYWQIMDPTNGYTAVHATALRQLELDRLDRRYFFESDMLYRLSLLRAVVTDIPMAAVYGNEKSSLRIGRVVLEFPWKYFSRLCKRIFYNYFLRDFNLGTLQFTIGVLLMALGGLFGAMHYLQSIQTGIPATSGTVMIAGLPIILGFQSLLAALQFDVTNAPSAPIHPRAFGAYSRPDIDEPMC